MNGTKVGGHWFLSYSRVRGSLAEHAPRDECHVFEGRAMTRGHPGSAELTGSVFNAVPAQLAP